MRVTAAALQREIVTFCSTIRYVPERHVPRPTASERSENSRGDRVPSRSRNRASIRRIRRRTGSGRAVSRRRQDFLDQRRLTASLVLKKQTPTEPPKQ